MLFSGIDVLHSNLRWYYISGLLWVFMNNQSLIGMGSAGIQEKGLTMASKDYCQYPRVVSVVFIVNCRGAIALIPIVLQ